MDLCIDWIPIPLLVGFRSPGGWNPIPYWLDSDPFVTVWIGTKHPLQTPIFDEDGASFDQPFDHILDSGFTN